MATAPDTDNKDKAPANSAEPETLKQREGEAEPKVESVSKDAKITHTPISEEARKHRLRAFRPSHKATFIGLGVVVAILGINAAVLGYLLTKESANSKAINDHGVSISPGTLSKLGVNDTQIGNSNEKLTVDPAAQFNSSLTVGGDVSIGGALHLNSTLVASNANLSQLQAGNTTANSININGAATASTLSVRNNLAVNGAAIFNNDVTIGQLLSVDNNAAVSNNLSVGGQLSANSIASGSLVVTGSITLGSHIITSGATPSISGGSALGSNGTYGVYGNDASGTINIGIGSGPSGTDVVQVSFRSAYTQTPVVVISPEGNFAEFFVTNLTKSGFEVDTASTLTVGDGYQINYIVEQ
ncbi:MAG: hypothetical protein ACREF7_04175 [Candidatus Saccharimonadales bacterium]